MRGVLFLCTGNSCRSQMAEGFARFYAKGQCAIFSAGTHPTAIHPLAIQVMEERAINLHEQISTHIDEIPMAEIDTVITLCDSAAQSCPTLPGKSTIDWSLPDPALLTGCEDERLRGFRAIREEIDQRVRELMEQLVAS